MAACNGFFLLRKDLKGTNLWSTLRGCSVRDFIESSHISYLANYVQIMPRMFCSFFRYILKWLRANTSGDQHVLLWCAAVVFLPKGIQMKTIFHLASEMGWFSITLIFCYVSVVGCFVALVFALPLGIQLPSEKVFNPLKTPETTFLEGIWIPRVPSFLLYF